jgi:hypothetical protein
MKPSSRFNQLIADSLLRAKAVRSERDVPVLVLNTQAEQEGRLGDPAYERLMLDNDKHVTKLADLYPARKHEHSGPGGERPDLSSRS